jgi:hypothetical protein
MRNLLPPISTLRMDAADFIETLIITSVSNTARNEQPKILIFKVAENLKSYVRLYFWTTLCHVPRFGRGPECSANKICYEASSSVPGLVVDLQRKITGKLNRETNSSGS